MFALLKTFVLLVIIYIVLNGMLTGVVPVGFNLVTGELYFFNVHQDKLPERIQIYDIP